KKWLFYLDVTNSKLGQIDAATGKETKSIKVEGDLLTLSQDGKSLYVAGTTSSGKGSLQVIDPITLAIRKAVVLDLAPFAISAGSGVNLFMSGAPEGFTSIAQVDTEQGTTKYLAPIQGGWQLQWLPGRIVAYPNTAATELKSLKLPVDPKKMPDWETIAVANTNPVNGPPQVTSDGKFLIARSGTVLNATDLKPAAKIDEFLSLSIDAEAGTAFALNTSGWLKEYSYPDWKEKTKWKLPLTAYQVAHDGKTGKLFLSVVDPETIRTRPRAKGFGDVWVVEVKDLGK
ncbi:MAG: hypothetical protein K8T89_12530, partial [Planctomycetes bacterium]|nr:hypothetical protein [Planctomycetota bacterium]